MTFSNVVTLSSYTRAKHNIIQWNLIITRTLRPWKLFYVGFLAINQKYKESGWKNCLVIRGFCYILPLYNEAPLYEENEHSKFRPCFNQAILYATVLIWMRFHCKLDTRHRKYDQLLPFMDSILKMHEWLVTQVLMCVYNTLSWYGCWKLVHWKSSIQNFFEAFCSTLM